MGFLALLLIGGVAGYIASLLTKTRTHSVWEDIFFGALGALLASVVAWLFGLNGFTGFNWHSFFVALIGAVALILIAKHIKV